MMAKNRYDRGLEKIRELNRDGAERFIEDLKAIAPDLARYTIEFAFGDVYDRPGLDLKSREIVAIAALAALGSALPQLKFHLEGALNVGCSREEILEVFFQVAIYAGFPAALNAISCAQEVFRERDERKG